MLFYIKASVHYNPIVITNYCFFILRTQLCATHAHTPSDGALFYKLNQLIVFHRPTNTNISTL